MIWVNSLGLRAPTLTLKDGARVLGKFGDLARRVLASAGANDDERGPQPDRIIAPAAIPLPGNETAGQITRALVSRQVKGAMEALDITRPILWTSLPTAEPLLGAFR